jgi:hypothetical protein
MLRGSQPVERAERGQLQTIERRRCDEERKLSCTVALNARYNTPDAQQRKQVHIIIGKLIYSFNTHMAMHLFHLGQRWLLGPPFINEAE